MTATIVFYMFGTISAPEELASKLIVIREEIDDEFNRKSYILPHQLDTREEALNMIDELNLMLEHQEDRKNGWSTE